MKTGKLYVFEGADGVGKSEISKRFAHLLRTSGFECDYMAFPGLEKGTLGKHVYELHHEPQKFEVESLSEASLQILHVAAHVDAIETRIKPALKSGRMVVLDRFWWSTVVYGTVLGVQEEVIDGMIKLENISWGMVRPSALFLVRRNQPLRSEPLDRWYRITQSYQALVGKHSKDHPTYIIDNNGTIEDALRSVLQSLPGRFRRRAKKQKKEQPRLPLSCDPVPTPIESSAFVFSSLSPAKPTIVFDTFWRFAAERQAIFFKRFRGSTPPWTDDEILSKYKFTNAYRASDRVSQFLIKDVIYKGDGSPAEVFFRTILFKLFNKIETWEWLNDNLGPVSYKEYSFKRYDGALSEALRRGKAIYSGAYMMPSGHKVFKTNRKHRAHLQLLERLMEDEVFYSVCNAKNMFEGFKLLRSYPLFGDFLAYQYITDLNYSALTDFSEMEFVTPGPGARDGIRKCFSALGGLSEADIIRFVAERQQDEFEQRELDFQSLWGRPLQLIDCQNLFCEVDKYSRVRHPEFAGPSGRKRIKQKFSSNSTSIEYWYPPKWELNHLITDGPGQPKLSPQPES